MTAGRALSELPRGTFDVLDRALAKQRAHIEVEEIGTVVQVGRGIARVAGLTEAGDNELVRFRGGLLGLTANLDREGLGVILLGDGSGLEVGSEARRTHRAADVPVGEGLLGRIVDAVGRPRDDKGPVRASDHVPIERPAPPIILRAPVAVPLQTGIKAVDAAIPIGRGQRELILGDRQTGKTALALDAIINQRGSDIVCIYCAIGQRGSAVARVVAALAEHDAMDQAIVMVAGGEDAPGLQFVAPYAATSMAEFFMQRGRDVLIVYDDLTRHARAYRELSLLLRRPPGREAYPGDIFFIHSRLLERATHLRKDKGGGSLTALPIIETQAQNIAAYIPTNLISITDGQIYLSPELFHKGHLPAVDIGRSVSRVGGRAQLPAYRAVAGDLRLSYAQFEELETFARFGTRLDEDTRRNLERGRRVREVLKQNEHELVPVAEQVAVLLAATRGLFDTLPVDSVAEAEAELRRVVREVHPDLCHRIAAGEALDEAARETLLALARRTLDAWRA
jgi:F-type H+-transporting ATPase subunit alpha